MAKGTRRGWALFCGVPENVHLLEGGVFQGNPVLLQALFDLVEAMEELVVGSLEGDFGIDAEFAGEVGDDKKQITDFSLEFAGGGLAGLVFGEFLADLGQFFIDLTGDACGVWPVKADFTCFFLELGGLEEGGQSGAHAVEIGFFLVSFFGSLDVLPLGEDAIGAADVGFTVDVGMAANEFVADATGNIIEVEALVLPGEFGVEDDLEGGSTLPGNL